jgi:hypothetical protein
MHTGAGVAWCTQRDRKRVCEPHEGSAVHEQLGQLEIERRGGLV